MSHFIGLLGLLGVRSEWEEQTLHIHGRGLFELSKPSSAIDVRGDAHVAAFALGLLVGRPFESELLVDEVVAELLVPVLESTFGIRQTPEGQLGVRLLLPVVEGRCDGLSVSTGGFYPWVKQALLLIGLRAKSPTTVEERIASADHLERALSRCRIPIDVQGTVAVLHPPRDGDAIAPQVYDHVGSQSLAAPLMAAAFMHHDGRVSLRDVATNPTSSDFLSVARLSGATIGLSPLGDRQGEPIGILTVNAGTLRSFSVSGENTARLGDSAVMLFALAARARGTSHFSDLVARARGADPRIWTRALAFLTAAGVKAEVQSDGISIQGTDHQPFLPLTVTTGGDARLALLATVLALGAKGPSVIDDVECLGLDFPRFVGSLRALGARVEVNET
jgi:3-phosphoshikimate 1-carboxyvinyltransferase